MDDTGELHPDEAGLVERARQNDELAWTAIVGAYQEPVFRLAYLILDDHHEAEDAAQEALLRAYRALDRYDPERPLKPWLLSIAANTARNRRRAVWRYWKAVKRLFQAEAGIAEDPRVTVAENSEARRLWEAVQRLSEQDRQVIYLRYFMELPVDETAATLAIPAGTVKSRLHRALARLKAVIETDFRELMDD